MCRSNLWQVRPSDYQVSELYFGFRCIGRFAAASEQEDIDAVSLTGLQKLPDLSQVIIYMGSIQPTHACGHFECTLQ